MSGKTEDRPFDQLKSQLGIELPAITAAREQAIEVSNKLENLCETLAIPQNTAVVAFGSLARREWTSGSDVDWTFLLDGPADPEHFQLERKIADAMEFGGFTKPGATGTFGAMTNSHELIHHVGGTEDSNQNLTRRILLILESCCLSDVVPHERVLKGILNRYIVCDPDLSILGKGSFRVPRFLLNDIVRYWRTVAVDYATKKWRQQGTKWALRNVKLRMSRKLFYVKGLLMCFDCELRPRDEKLPEDADVEVVGAQLSNRCFKLSKMTPIDILSRALMDFGQKNTSEKIMTAYDGFLDRLNNESMRRHLAGLGMEDASNDAQFQEMRRFSHDFRDGLDKFFFDDSPQLSRLIREYGVF